MDIKTCYKKLWDEIKQQFKYRPTFDRAILIVRRSLNTSTADAAAVAASRAVAYHRKSRRPPRPPPHRAPRRH